MPKYHPAELTAKVVKNADYGDSFTWETFFSSVELDEGELDGKSADSLAVPLTTFKEHVLREYIEHVVSTPNLLVSLNG